MIGAVCPSRGRPSNVARLAESWRLTEATADLIVCVDDDDPLVDEYRSLDLPGIELVVGPAKRFAGWINQLAPGMAERYEIVGVLGDDNVCRTMHWDRRIEEAMPALGVVWGDDRFQGRRLATAPFVDARLVRHLGWLAPPGVEHLYVDNTWMVIGSHFGTLTYLPDVVIEHAHPFAHKARMDEVYRAANSPERYAADLAAFAAWVSGPMSDDLAGLTP